MELSSYLKARLHDAVDGIYQDACMEYGKVPDNWNALSESTVNNLITSISGILETLIEYSTEK